MPPDSADSYLRLIRAIDRKPFMGLAVLLMLAALPVKLMSLMRSSVTSSSTVFFPHTSSAG